MIFFQNREVSDLVDHWRWSGQCHWSSGHPQNLWVNSFFIGFCSGQCVSHIHLLLVFVKLLSRLKSIQIFLGAKVFIPKVGQSAYAVSVCGSMSSKLQMKNQASCSTHSYLTLWRHILSCKLHTCIRLNCTNNNKFRQTV